MTDWTADDIVAGRQVSEEETWRRVSEAMADPESVTLVVIGRNGQRVESRIPRHDRTRLSVLASHSQEEPDFERYLFQPVRLTKPPSWRQWTWTVRAETSYRPEDWKDAPAVSS